MGSGETSPTMVKVHRALLERVGGPAVLLDTPYGFQMNADDLSSRSVRYFRDSVGTDVDVVGYRTSSEQGSVAYEQAMSRLRDAAYVFAGPGSPSYALRHWEGSSVPDLLREKLRSSGCVTFASAAALTLGIVTVPVYEIYKVGAEPHWSRGLDLLSEVGLCAAVIPHYDNAEGGNHDTRYSYLGEERLSAMESELPELAFVLGIDEHTGVVFDLDAATATVVGRGAMTARARGASHRWPAGAVVGVDEVQSVVDRLRTDRALVADDGAASTLAGRAVSPSAETLPPVTGETFTGSAGSPLLDAAAAHAEGFEASLAAGDAGGAVQALLDFEADLQAWAADPTQSDEADRARSVLRSLIVRLGEVAEGGTRDPREVVGPYVELVLDARRDAREGRRFEEADALRDRLVALGVEVNDTPEGTEWGLPG